MKRFLIILLLALVAGGGFYYFSKSSAVDTESTIEYKTIHIKKGPLIVRISATGVVEPNFQVEVKSKASGRVLKFPLVEGDRVKKNQLLLELDKSDEQRNVARAEADLQSSNAKLKKADASLLLQKTKYETDLTHARSEVSAATTNLKDAEDKLKRQVDLFDQLVSAEETLESARTTSKVNLEVLQQAQARLLAAENAIHDITLKENEIELAKAEVTRSQIALDEASEKLDETEIFAPISGVITEKLVEVGQIISSGISNVSGGTTLLNIADLSRLYITADVDETDIGVVKIGQEVVITTDAYPGKELKGTVKRIAPKGQIENSITLFKVKIEILGKGKSILKPMMSANVDIVTKEELRTLVLPREAIWKEDKNYYAGILEDDEPKKVLITPGTKNLTHVQIVAGLEENQVILLNKWEEIQEMLDNKNKGKSTLNRILFIIGAR